MKTSKLITLVLLSLLIASCSQTEKEPVAVNISSSGQIPYLEKQGTAARLIVDGKPFLMISGELHNSTCGGFEFMRPVWKRMAEKNLNSVIATVSWELIEPEEGRFDFALVDSTIAGARQAGLKLALIWFGSWKNSGSVYIPSWVKRDYEKYPRVVDEEGKPLEILSTLGKESEKADAKAYAALMRHIKEVDYDHTVIIMQVENEIGVLDMPGKNPGAARRDFSSAANSAYNGPVPAKLIDYLVQHKEDLFPELRKVWAANGYKTIGTWEQVFGKSTFKPDPKDWQHYSFYTEELFMAWNYAMYVGAVAEAGKAEYPLPIYVNAWLKQPGTRWPGKYPSGGPLPQVIDVWRAAAPAIDFIAPDIYIDEFTWTCEEFMRSGNPLFIPETRGGEAGAARAFFVFGEYSAGCFAPFGIDNPRWEKDDPLDLTYSALRKLEPLILEHQGKGTMRGILIDEKTPVNRFESGDYVIEAKLDSRKLKTTGGIIIQTGPEEFVCTGRALDVFFLPKDNSHRVALDIVDEGTFIDGRWTPERRLNGDETHASTFDGAGLRLPEDRISIQRVSLYKYK
jgi:beta-galactosidase GanA